MVIADGTLEAIKWLGLVAMTGDHINKYLLNSAVDGLYRAGRIALPLFLFVLAYNLARPSPLRRGVYQRMIQRLALVGVLSTPAFLALGGLVDGWWPLNIMFTLLAVAATVYSVDLGAYLAAVTVFLLTGALVEFWWPGILLGLSVWWYIKRPCWMPAGLALTALCGLCWVNGNLWAAAALPIILIASRVDLRVPRVWWLFYAFYPLHLCVLWLIRISMGKAGYLFFT